MGQKRDGLIPMKNGGGKTGKPSTLRSLREWIEILVEVFPKKALSPEQVIGYAIPLEEFSLRELELGFRRTLREWKWADMPPPAFIRLQIAAELELEWRSKPKEPEIIPARLTLEEAWDDWIETERLGRKMREKMLIIEQKHRDEMERKYSEGLVIASPARLQELERQKKILEEKYGKGPVVRVRDSAPPETDKGGSGAE